MLVSLIIGGGVLLSDGEEVRKLPCPCARRELLARRVDGIFLSEFEQGEIGPDLFRHACLMGLEGMVSKHRESLYAAAVLVASLQERCQQEGTTAEHSPFFSQ